MPRSFIIIILFIIAVIFLVACNKSGVTKNSDPCFGTTASFSADVNPIIQTYCNQPGCHSPGSFNGPGALTNYSQVFSARSRIRVQIEAGLMPQNATLSTTPRNKILCCIDSGALNN
ncbi:MAG TPA: hypothetical protein P5158_04845 [Chitinophagaceae bacterium]|nr:hypothetical protein [Chitinophagaceae bacterium]